jgi:hypothetical protein
MMHNLNPKANKYNLEKFPEMKYKPLSEPYLNACLKDVRQSARIKRIAKKIAVTFKLSGLSDVGYVANVIGGGMPNYDVIADRLVDDAYPTMVKRAGYTPRRAKNYIVNLLESNER